jgi:hypothetical protein
LFSGTIAYTPTNSEFHLASLLQHYLAEITGGVYHISFKRPFFRRATLKPKLMDRMRTRFPTSLIALFPTKYSTVHLKRNSGLNGNLSLPKHFSGSNNTGK